MPTISFWLRKNRRLYNEYGHIQSSRVIAVHMKQFKPKTLIWFWHLVTSLVSLAQDKAVISSIHVGMDFLFQISVHIMLKVLFLLTTPPSQFHPTPPYHLVANGTPESWATCHMPPTDYWLPPATCHLPPAICHLPPDTWHLPPATCCLPPATYFFFTQYFGGQWDPRKLDHMPPATYCLKILYGLGN